MGVENYEPSEWRLLIDTSKHGLESVLLDNVKQHPSMAQTHSVHAKDWYDEESSLIIKYDTHKWNLCIDLKWQISYLDNKVDKQSFLVFSVCSIVLLEIDIACKKTGQLEQLQLPVLKLLLTSHMFNERKLLSHHFILN